MAMSDDQKAMLRLLAQREEGYEDIAALMGISVEEVRGRVREALAEVDGAEATPPRPPAPATPEPSRGGSGHAPPAPPAPPASEPPTRRPGRRPSPIRGLKLPRDRGALVGLAAGGAAVVIMAIVLIVGGSGGGSSSTAPSTGGGTAPATAESRNLTQAILAPVDGSEASGVALFGRFKKKVLLQVTAEGLEPSQSGESYAVWLSHAGEAMVPVGTTKVPGSGDLATRFEIPTAVLLLISRGAFDEIAVTRTSDARLSAAIEVARKNKAESAYTGTEVMRGKITGPFVGAAKRR